MVRQNTFLLFLERTTKAQPNRTTTGMIQDKSSGSHIDPVDAEGSYSNKIFWTIYSDKQSNTIISLIYFSGSDAIPKLKRNQHEEKNHLPNKKGRQSRFSQHVNHS